MISNGSRSATADRTASHSASRTAKRLRNRKAISNRGSRKRRKMSAKNLQIQGKRAVIGPSAQRVLTAKVKLESTFAVSPQKLNLSQLLRCGHFLRCGPQCVHLIETKFAVRTAFAEPLEITINT